MSDRWTQPDAYRAHRRGIHEYCDYLYCQARQKLEYQAEETNFAKAVLKLLKDRGIDARVFFGTNYDATVAMAKRELEPWLPQQPDTVTILSASGAVDDAIVEEITHGTP